MADERREQAINSDLTRSASKVKENIPKREISNVEKEKEHFKMIKKKGKTNVTGQRNMIKTRADVLWHQHSFDVVVLYHSCKPGRERHNFDFYATPGCARGFMGEGIREGHSSSYGALVMKAFEQYCRDNWKTSKVLRESEGPATATANEEEIPSAEMRHSTIDLRESEGLATASTNEAEMPDVELRDNSTDLCPLNSNSSSSNDPPLPSSNVHSSNVASSNVPSSNVPSTSPTVLPLVPPATENNRRRTHERESVVFTEVPSSLLSLPSPSSIPEDLADGSLAAMVNSSEPPAMSTSIAKPGDVTCFGVGSGVTKCWIFPANISQSTLDGRNGSHACTVITLLLGSVILELVASFPRVGQLNQLWCSLIEKCIRLGNKVYDETESQQSTRDLAPDEAAYALRSRKKIRLEEPLAVRCKDQHEPTRLAYQIERMMAKEMAAAAFVQGDRSFLLMTEENGNILAVDTHTHLNGTQGAVILTSNAVSDMAGFIRALEAIFSLEEDSFGNLVKFY